MTTQCVMHAYIYMHVYVHIICLCMCCSCVSPVFSLLVPSHALICLSVSLRLCLSLSLCLLDCRPQRYAHSGGHRDPSVLYVVSDERPSCLSVLCAASLSQPRQPVGRATAAPHECGRGGAPQERTRETRSRAVCPAYLEAEGTVDECSGVGQP